MINQFLTRILATFDPFSHSHFDFFSHLHFFVKIVEESLSPRSNFEGSVLCSSQSINQTSDLVEESSTQQWINGSSVPRRKGGGGKSKLTSLSDSHVLETRCYRWAGRTAAHCLASGAAGCAAGSGGGTNSCVCKLDFEKHSGKDEEGEIEVGSQKEVRNEAVRGLSLSSSPFKVARKCQTGVLQCIASQTITAHTSQSVVF